MVSCFYLVRGHANLPRSYRPLWLRIPLSGVCADFMNSSGGQIRVNITHACGHTRRPAAYPGASFEDWKRKLEQSDCPDCWLKKQPPTFTLRTRQQGGYAIDVSRGYPIKGVLSGRGYFFQRPRWIKHFETEAQREDEIRWIREQGYKVTDAEA